MLLRKNNDIECVCFTVEYCKGNDLWLDSNLFNSIFSEANVTVEPYRCGFILD